MLTKVRIAPMGQWCPSMLEMARYMPRYADLVGLEVEIETASMRHALAVGSVEVLHKAWMLTLESTRKMDEISGQEISSEPETICEHMLEMD